MVEDEREGCDGLRIFREGARPGRVFPNSHDVNLTSRDVLRADALMSSRSNRRHNPAGGGLSRFLPVTQFSSSPSMATLPRLSLVVLLLLGLVSASRFEVHPNVDRSSQPHRSPRSKRVSRRSCQAPLSTDTSACFPALGFTMPSNVPASTNGWWCDPVNEYAFLGFSYEITACKLPRSFFLSFRKLFLLLNLGQSLSQLQADFANIRNNFNGRYVRLYGACDNQGF